VQQVAPHAGAWIETYIIAKLIKSAQSLPTRERGLKRFQLAPIGLSRESLPTRERGLKLHELETGREYHGSLPTRERGLKPGLGVLVRRNSNVAPHAGAWIETLT